MKRLLVATDFSRRADTAAAWAVGLAADVGASVVLYHAVSIEGPGHPAVQSHSRSLLDSMRESSEAAAKESMAALSALAPGVAIESKIEETPARVDAIVDAAKSQSADMIVMGTRGENALSRSLLGSVAAGVMNEAKCAVTLVPRHARYHGLARLLLLSDCEDLPGDLRSLATLMGARRPRLQVMHLRHANDAPVDLAVETLAAVAGWNDAHFVDCVSNEWVDSIDEAVADVEADLLCMTVHPHGALYRLFHRDFVHSVAFQSIVPLVGLRASHTK